MSLVTRHSSLRRPAPLLAALAAAAFAPAARAHEEWHNLHLLYSAAPAYVYPFDGRAPKLAAVALNHYDAPSAPFVFSVRLDGRPAPAVFPGAGALVVPAHDYRLAAVSAAPVVAALAPGETREVEFLWDFALAPGAVAPPRAGTANPDPGNASADPPHLVRQRVRFTSLGDDPRLEGTFPCAGTVRLPPAGFGPLALAAPPRVEVGTPHSAWYPLPAGLAADTPDGPVYSFSRFIPARGDWHVRVSAPGCTTVVVPLGAITDPHPPLALALAAAEAPDLGYRRTAAISVPAGLRRAVVAAAEGTLVAFPGQDTWPAAAGDGAARALRAASRIFKYRFDGTRLWERAPGWETGGADHSADGRFVAYTLHPAAHPFYLPPPPAVVLLDGATGAVLWEKTAPASDPVLTRALASLELAFSPDARLLAVGAASGGVVTLLDRATGSVVWTTPAEPIDTFGAVRRLRFDPDGRHLYCGTGDGRLRRLRVADGATLWTTFAGGWPLDPGLTLTPDREWLAAGIHSLDALLVRTRDGAVAWQRETQAAGAELSPDGRHLATAGGHIFRTLDGALVGATRTAGPVRFTPDGSHLIQAGRDLRLHDLGGTLLRTFEPAGLAAAQSVRALHLSPDGRSAVLVAGDHLAPDQVGLVFYQRLPAAAPAAPPVVVSSPLPQTAALGATVTLHAAASGPGPLAYQWSKDDLPLPADTGSAATLVLPAVTAADAGRYVCTVSNSAGSVATASAVLSVVAPAPSDPPRLANLAVRAPVGPAALAVGFAVGGAGTAGTKPLLLRGAGPALAAFGVAAPLGDPQLALFAGSARLLANDDWAGAADLAALAARVGAFPFAADSRDAALALTAVGGSFTAHLTAPAGQTGEALAEIYDGSTAFTPATRRLVNLSARGTVAPATSADPARVLVAGFTVTGSAAVTVLVRGIGPALAAFGVADAHPAPALTLLRDTTVVAANAGWHDAPNALALSAATARVGAFPLAAASRDAALLLSLPPGAYTAQVSASTAALAGELPPASAGPAGQVLLEVYAVP